MLARADTRRKTSATEACVQQLDVTGLDFADSSFDAAVARLSVLRLADAQQSPALQELGRVVKAGGAIRLLEYVRPHGTFRRIVARFWEPWIAWAHEASFHWRTAKHVPKWFPISLS